MMVEKCPSKQTSCTKCGNKIGLGSLRVHKNSYGGPTKYYHLSCYKPQDPRAVDFDKHVYLKKVTEEKDVERVKKWVDKWNKQFIAKEENLPVQFKTKTVETCSTPLRRLLLETFQYLEVKEIELLVGFVCKEWFHITRDNEFWKSRYVALYPDSDTSEGATYRTKLILLQTRSNCWLCHLHVPFEKISFMCPYRKRPMCAYCFRSNEGLVVPLKPYFQQKQISASLVKHLHFRHFIYHKCKHNYLYDLAETIIPYAEKRKKDLLTALQTHYSSEISQDSLQEIDNFDVVEYYKTFNQRFNWECVAISIFCGENDLVRSFDDGVKQFLSNFLQYRRSCS